MILDLGIHSGAVRPGKSLYRCCATPVQSQSTELQRSHSTNTNASPSVVCECSSYFYDIVHVAQAPSATSGAIVELGTVTSTSTVTFTTSAGACSYTAASQASSISNTYVKTSATSTTSAASMTPSTTPPPSSLSSMTCSVMYGISCRSSRHKESLVDPINVQIK